MVLTFSSYKKLQRGETAPSFILKGIDEKTHKLEELKGKKATLIIFMCNHCPYVVPKFQYINELGKKYAQNGLSIIGINSNDTENYPEDSFEKMKEYAQKYDFNFTYLIDETQQIAKEYGAECTPDPFLFDKDLKLTYHGRFDDAHRDKHEKGTTAEMEDAIKETLEEKQISVGSLPSCGCNIKWKKL
jgi:peroxiredoxin